MPREKEIDMNQLPRINVVKLLVCALMLNALWVSPLMAGYSNPAVAADSQDPAFWLDRGAFFATYGNYVRAVEAYQKVLTLDDNNGKAHYDIALAYGELGELDQALTEINRAIALDAGTSRYYYGRAWILLKSGHSAEAMNDFQKAASMGDQDAIDYLEGSGKN